jgi:hypothetical protein
MRDGDPKVPSEVLSYYERFPEESRLMSGPFRLEFERTKEILSQVLPKPPSVVVDVGGAPEDLARELESSELQDVRVFGARALEREPSILGASAHLLGVGRKRR